MLVQRSPSEGGVAVYIESCCTQRQRILKIAQFLIVTLIKVRAAFSGTSLLICFLKGQSGPFESPLTFFTLFLSDVFQLP